MRQRESIRRRWIIDRGRRGLTVHTRISRHVNYVLMLKQWKENIQSRFDERDRIISRR